MLIFLAGLAVLLALAVLGSRASTSLFRHGEDPFFVRCDVCERRYPRSAGTVLAACPAGHPLTAPAAAPRPHSAAGTLFVALCLGFAIAVVVLAVTGHVQLP